MILWGREEGCFTAWAQGTSQGERERGLQNPTLGWQGPAGRREGGEAFLLGWSSETGFLDGAGRARLPASLYMTGHLWMDPMLNPPQYQKDKLGSVGCKDVSPPFGGQILPHRQQEWIFQFGFSHGK